MKNKYFSVFLMMLILAVTVNAQDWKIASSQTLPNVEASFFLNANVGWYVGDGGLIQKTTDGGKTWNTVATTITDDLKSVYFLDENTGFVGGVNKLHKTTDGFATSTTVSVTGSITTSSSSSGYWGIYFADAVTGWFLSSKTTAAKVLHTADGGTTWDEAVNLTTGPLQTMEFFNGSSGIVAGGGASKFAVFYTKDGLSWAQATAPTFSFPYTRMDVRGMYVIDAMTTVAGGWGSVSQGQPVLLIKTTDGGATWTHLEQTDENKTYEYVYSLYFKDSNNGLAVGGGTKSSGLIKTTNGGVTWTAITIPCGAQISKLHGFGNTVIAQGANFFIKTTDFGKNWELLTQTPAATLYTIFAVNDNVIYAGGNDGLILKSTNGGQTWQGSYILANNVSPTVYGLYFVDENTGYAGCDYSLIAKTTNGGKTWTTVRKDSVALSMQNYAAAFTGANVGFIVGKQGSNVDVIYKTTDGGNTLTETKNIVGSCWRGVAFYNSNIGAVVGEKMKAAYTADGGTTWTASTINGVPSGSETNNLREVAFYSATEAVAVGDKVTLKTTDGGATWNYIGVEITQSLTGVAAMNDVTWAVGYKSSKPKSWGVLQSMDKGQSWANTVDYSVFDTTNSVFIYDVAATPSGAAFVCATSSVIYMNNTLVGVEENENQLPAAFQLEQNYPNPFNPTTVIGYRLPVTGMVTLKIYDLLGREVAALVNEVQQAGKYSIQLSADSYRLSSGIYFYQLKAGENFVQTKKMIMLK